MRVNLLCLAFFLLIGAGFSAVKKIAVQPVKVEGIAMEPGLKHGDRIFIARSYDRIDRGDIVIFYYPADQSKSYISASLAFRMIELKSARAEFSSTERVFRSHMWLLRRTNPCGAVKRLSWPKIAIMCWETTAIIPAIPEAGDRCQNISFMESL